MKEFENNDKAPESHYEANKQKEYKHVHSFIPKTGCKLFRWDKDKSEMVEVIIDEKFHSVFVTGNKKQATAQYITEKRAHYNPNDLYFQALNKKSALKKYNRYLAGETHLV